VVRDLGPAIRLHEQSHPVALEPEDIREQTATDRHVWLHHRLHIGLEQHALPFEHPAGQHHAREPRHLVDR
jgi:hypothetical protein